MTGNTFDFDIRSEWTLDARPEELTAVVLDAGNLQRWCPNVFLQCEELDRGAPDGLGLTVRFHSKGWLPHSFFCIAQIVDLVPHVSMEIRVTGDFDGTGLLEVSASDSGQCHAVLHWRTDIRHPVIRPLVRWFHPAFVMNHKWAMRRARALMQAEIDRRRAGSPDFPEAHATFPHNIPWFRSAWKRGAALDRG